MIGHTKNRKVQKYNINKASEEQKRAWKQDLKRATEEWQEKATSASFTANEITTEFLQTVEKSIEQHFRKKVFVHIVNIG